MVTIALTHVPPEGPLLLHLVSLVAPFWVDQCRSHWVGSDFLHQLQLLMSVHFEKKNLLQGPTPMYLQYVLARHSTHTVHRIAQTVVKRTGKQISRLLRTCVCSLSISHARARAHKHPRTKEYVPMKLFPVVQLVEEEVTSTGAGWTGVSTSSCAGSGASSGASDGAEARD